MKHNYPAIFVREEDKYVVEFPDLPDCKTEGANIVKAMRAAKKMVAAYLTESVKSGVELPVPTGLDEVEVPEDGFATYIEVNLGKNFGLTREELKEKHKKARKLFFISAAALAVATATGVGIAYALHEKNKKKSKIVLIKK